MSMSSPQTDKLTAQLTDEELDALGDFLAAPAHEERSMDVATLEGFLTALAVGPRSVLPSRWLPWVWDRIDGTEQPEFDGLEQANCVLQWIMRFNNSVVQQFTREPAGFEPIYRFGAQWGAAEWCEGFLTGMQFDSEAWAGLMAAQPEWFAPFLRLGTDEGLALLQRDKDKDPEHWLSRIVPSLVEIHRFWLAVREQAPEGLVEDEFLAGHGPQQPIVRTAPKVGRNDPCPCGSGMKYKKCCGSGAPVRH